MPFRTSPFDLLRSLFRHRNILLALTRREITLRYKGSLLGMFWSFVHPVLMLFIYTFVFSVVFKARWNGQSDTSAEFALIAFAGLIMFNFFAECLNKAPFIIISNANYVNKIAFPVEIFSFVTVGAALFNAAISLAIWTVYYFSMHQQINMTIILVPFVFLPVAFLAMGACWFISSIGVYFRDASQIVTILTTILMFVSPIFFPESAIPSGYGPVIELNPIAFAISTIRDVIYWGRPFDTSAYLAYMIKCMLFCWAGFIWFQKTRRGFADVL